MNTVQHKTASIPLASLSLSALNVRKTRSSQSADDELRASILSHGLIENLAVIPGENGSFEVIAGGRRLSALQDLRAQEMIPEDITVNCSVIETGQASPEEISLTENLTRDSMHPADQVEIFSHLVSRGATIEDIANRFGISARTVSRRVALGDVAPEIIQAFRDDKIDLEYLKAYSITTDHARQLKVFEQCETSEMYTSAYRVRSLLTETSTASNSPIAMFVGVEAYEEAGGRVDRDLFSHQDDTVEYFLDYDILNLLAIQKLSTHAKKLASKWRWAESSVEFSFSERQQFRTLQPEIDGKPTAKEKSTLDKILPRIQKLESMDERNNKQSWELTSLYDKRDTIARHVERRAKHSAKQRKLSGCVVTITRDGRPLIYEGLVRSEDDKQDNSGINTGAGGGSDYADAASSVTSGTSHNESTSGNSASDKSNGIPPGVSKAHATDLRIVRSNIVKVALARDPEACRNLMAFQVCCPHFREQGFIDRPFDLAVRPSATRPSQFRDDQNWQDPSENELSEIFGSLPLEWASSETENVEECYNAFMALNQSERDTLLAWVVSQSLCPSSRDEKDCRQESTPLEKTIESLDIDFRDYRPTQEVFWQRATAAYAIEQVEQYLGADEARKARKLNKKDLVKYVLNHFGPDNVNPATADWTVPGFAAAPTSD